MLTLAMTAVALTPPYYFNPTIHNLGNRGPGGLVHALLAPLATSVIDKLAYDGFDVRSFLHQGDSVDFCCGTGTSTAKGCVGIDTSTQMLGMARMMHPDKHFIKGNAEDWGETDLFSVATCMFAFHEMPREARATTLSNMKRVARDKVMVVDIHPDYNPSPAMLMGEPYVKEYLAHIDQDMMGSNVVDLVPNRVRCWCFM